MKPETQLVRAHSAAVDRATVHAYRDATPGPFYYQRFAHPVGAEAERLLSELEGGEALLFPSGMGAITAMMLALLGPGAKVAVADGGYYGTIGMLRGELVRWGLDVVRFDQTGEPPEADLVWLEPCANPLMTFPDLDAVIEKRACAGGRVAVDNTVLSPLLLRPLEHGADFVMHSATKILAGHHDALLGVVLRARSGCGSAPWRIPRRVTGIVAAPDPAWLLMRGLKTLGPRVERQSATALEIARRLTGHPAVERVRYPGLSDDVAARYLSARLARCCHSTSPTPSVPCTSNAHCALIENATSLGGVASTLEARARWEPERVPPGLLRLSVGLEDVDDLWADLTQALEG